MLTRWIDLPNFTFVALPIPKILGGTFKILGVTWQGYAPFSGKIIKGICLAYHCEYLTKFYIRSFTHSLDIRGYPKNFGSHVTGPRPFSGKIITAICLGCPSEYAYQILRS